MDIGMENNFSKIFPGLYKQKTQRKLRKMLYMAIHPEHLGLGYEEVRNMPIYMLMQLLEEHSDYLKKKAKATKTKK